VGISWLVEPFYLNEEVKRFFISHLAYLPMAGTILGDSMTDTKIKKDFNLYTLNLDIVAKVVADSKQSAFQKVLGEFDKFDAPPESGVDFVFSSINHLTEEVLTLEGDCLSFKERSCSCQNSFEDDEIVCPHCGEIH
jgi:hypothetical protein